MSTSNCHRKGAQLIDFLSDFYQNHRETYQNIIQFNRQNSQKYFGQNGIIEQIKLFLMTGPYNNPNSESQLHCTGVLPHVREELAECRS